MASPVDFAYYGGLLLAAPLLAVKLARARGRRHLAGLRERLGACAPRRGRRPCLWIHGVSVGEIRAASTLIDALERELPELELVLSTTTGSGQEVARRLYPGRRIIYFPLDFSWSVRRVFDAIRPDAVLLVELEIWPNFLLEARRRRVAVAVVNGRITHKSFRGYRLARGWLFDPLGEIGQLCVQTEGYAQRFRRLGIPPRAIHVTGSVKYDQLPDPAGQPADPAALAAQVAEVRRDLGIGPGEVVIMGGSTHPGEERALLEATRRLRARLPELGAGLRLVLAPRHSERTAEVARLIADGGDRAARRSERLAAGASAALAPGEVLLVDTVGELVRLYGAADVVFVGGSLIPHGGQNVLEPVLQAKPTLFGPYCDNFKEPVARLLAAAGARQVSDAEALEAALADLLADPAAAAAMGVRGRDALLAAGGATERTVAVLAPHLRRHLAARGARGARRGP